MKSLKRIAQAMRMEKGRITPVKIDSEYAEFIMCHKRNRVRFWRDGRVDCDCERFKEQGICEHIYAGESMTSWYPHRDE